MGAFESISTLSRSLLLPAFLECLIGDLRCDFGLHALKRLYDKFLADLSGASTVRLNCRVSGVGNFRQGIAKLNLGFGETPSGVRQAVSSIINNGPAIQSGLEVLTLHTCSGPAEPRPWPMALSKRRPAPFPSPLLSTQLAHAHCRMADHPKATLGDK